MDVPVDARATIELWIDVGKEEGGEDGRHNRLSGLVEEKGEDNFVNVIGERGQVERLGVRLYEVDEKGRRWLDRVEHDDGRALRYFRAHGNLDINTRNG